MRPLANQVFCLLRLLAPGSRARRVKKTAFSIPARNLKFIGRVFNESNLALSNDYAKSLRHRDWDVVAFDFALE